MTWSHPTSRPENKNKDEVRAEEISTKGATPDLNNPRTKSLMEREGSLANVRQPA